MMTSSKSSANSADIRIVFDTNVYIAALLRPGLSEELVKRGLKGEFKIITSESILQELEQKLREKSGFASEQINILLAEIRSKAEIIHTELSQSPTASRDPNDQHILACALGGKAQLIITLDQDLLVLKNWQKIGIIHPKTFTWIVPD